MLRRHHSAGERGQAALSLLVVGMLVSLAVIFTMAIPLTQASDAKARSRSAADAAALAGADWLRTDLHDALHSVGWLGGWDKLPMGDGGLSAAQSYAQRNDGELIAYDPPTPFNNWTAYAKVRGADVRGEPTTSEAWAKFELPACSQEETPTPSPTPTGGGGDGGGDGGSDTPTPPPPPLKWRCGDVEFDIPGDPLSGAPVLGWGVIAQLFENSDAKLVG